MSIPGIEHVSRRGLLAGTAAGGLVLALRPPARAQTAGQAFGADAMPNGWRDDPHLFIAISPDGIAAVTCHRSEMGPGVRTSVAMVVTEGLEADWARLRVAQADADEGRYGKQDTDGSRSLRHFTMPLRRAGAAARTKLEQAAAARWSVPAAECRAQGHVVMHAGSGRSLGYGELARDSAGRRRVRRGSRDLGGDLVPQRARGAGKPRPLRTHAYRYGAGRDPCPSRNGHRLGGADGWPRGARRSAGGAGAGECGLRCQRQAHPAPADPPSVRRCFLQVAECRYHGRVGDDARRGCPREAFPCQYASWSRRERPSCSSQRSLNPVPNPRRRKP